MSNLILQPFSYFPNPRIGKPLFNSSIYVGVPRTDPTITANQLEVFYKDENGNRVVLPQPVITNDGGLVVNEQGVVVQAQTDSTYSMRVFDRSGSPIEEYNLSDSGDFLQPGSGGNGVGSVEPVVAARQTGDGTNVTFTAPNSVPIAPQLLLVTVDGEVKRPGTDYTTPGTAQAVFTTPPPAGSNVDIIWYSSLNQVGNVSNSQVISTGSTTSRTLSDRFVDMVNVKDFGAVGDGVTDDTVAIQAAVDHARLLSIDIDRNEIPVGDGRIASRAAPILFFPVGHYLLTATVRVPGFMTMLGSRSYVFSNTLDFPLFTVSTPAHEISGFIFDGGSYHIFLTSTDRIEAADLHIHDCEFRVAREYCIGDDISVHFNYPMAVHIDNVKSYGSSFASLHNNGTYIKDSWIAWDVGHTDTSDNPLFDCSDPFVLENITEVPFGTNVNKTPRINIPSGRNLSLYCKSVRFGGEATGTPIVATHTDDDRQCELVFDGCAMFGVAETYWAEFYGQLPRKLVVKNAQGINNGGFVNCLGMRIATTVNPREYPFACFSEFDDDVPAVARRLITTDDRSRTIPTDARPVEFIFDKTPKQDNGLILTNHDTGNGFSFFGAPYTHTGSASFGGTVDFMGYSFPRWDFGEPNENVRIGTPNLNPSEGRGIYTCAVYVVAQNGSGSANMGYQVGTGPLITTRNERLEVGLNRIVWQLYYDGTNPVNAFFNISSSASLGNTTMLLGGLTINKGDTVGSFVPYTPSSISWLPEISYGDAPPTSGRWKTGSVRINIGSSAAPDANGFMLQQWRCRTGGTPGTWDAQYVRTTPTDAT